MGALMDISKPYSFAAFVITKDRPEILISTISKLLEQTLVPDYILIVDNSASAETKSKFQQMVDDRIGYHAVGYNSGPAGGAYWGLKLLFEKGFDWVLWVDDDDPPKFNNLFEDLFQIIYVNDNQFLGMVGAVGERFNRIGAKIVRLKDDQLKGYLDVDTISGNMFPLVSKRVLERGIMPTADFFFGFEDLGFCLAIKRAGFHILTSGDVHLNHRKETGRLNFNKKTYNKRSHEALWREYYSIRSLIFILLYQEKKLLGSCLFILKNMVKSMFVFIFGFRYGIKTFIMIWKGIIDGLSGRLGMRVNPVNKTIV
jgi:GT2 family glycosyltransferase